MIFNQFARPFARRQTCVERATPRSYWLAVRAILNPTVGDFVLGSRDRTVQRARVLIYSLSSRYDPPRVTLRFAKVSVVMTVVGTTSISFGPIGSTPKTCPYSP